MTQRIELIPTYINPDPDDIEKDAILKWTTIIREILDQSTNPLMVIGDLNKRGLNIVENDPVILANLTDVFAGHITF